MVEPGGPSLATKPYPGPVGLRRSASLPVLGSLSKASVVSYFEAWKGLSPSPTQPGWGQRGELTAGTPRGQSSPLHPPDLFQFLWLVEETWPLEQKKNLI